MFLDCLNIKEKENRIMGRKLGYFVTGGRYGFVGGVGGMRETSGKEMFERITRWIYAEEPGLGQR